MWNVKNKQHREEESCGNGYKQTTQPEITFSKLTIGTLEQGIKYGQS